MLEFHQVLVGKMSYQVNVTDVEGDGHPHPRGSASVALQLRLSE